MNFAIKYAYAIIYSDNDFHTIKLFISTALKVMYIS